MNVKEIKDEEIAEVLAEITSRGFMICVRHENGDDVEGVVEGVKEENGCIILLLNT